MKKFLLLLGAAVVSIGLFTSCEYENPQDYEKVLMPHLMTLYENDSVPASGYEIGPDYLAAIGVDSMATEGIREMQFIAIGKGKGLDKITTVPAQGWQTDSIPANANFGYLVRYHKCGTEGWLYRRLYIKSYVLLGGEDWYGKIQYDRRDWNPLANY